MIAAIRAALARSHTRHSIRAHARPGHQITAYDFTSAENLVCSGVLNGSDLTLTRSGLANNTATSAEGQANGGGLANGPTGVAALLESAVEGNAAISSSTDPKATHGGVGGEAWPRDASRGFRRRTAASPDARAMPDRYAPFPRNG